MTLAELLDHHVRDYGRDYTESDDGYSDMEAEERRGWRVVALWGRDGWNMGHWPYVMIYTRDRPDGQAELLSIVEGDRSEYLFDEPGDREAALDYIFLWHAAGESWAPISAEQREELDKGLLPELEPKWRGPVRVGET